MKHIFIINPAAGGGASEAKYLPLILHAVKEHNLDYEIHRSLSATDITNWVRQRAETSDSVRFYAVGGDGTANNVMSGIVGKDNAELAIIPCGTGNDFVKNWTHHDKNLNLSELFNGKRISVDVLKYHDKYSLNMLNIGADCDVVVESNKYKRLHGSSAYLVAALNIIPKGPEYEMTFSIDGGEEITGKYLLMCIANGQFCGGGFNSCPKASIHDGKMDLCLVSTIKGFKLVPLLMKYRAGKHLNDKKCQPYLTYVQCENFKLKALKEVNVSNDGEVYKFEEEEITVIPYGLNIVIPQSSELIL